jgi:hypothetical protein
VLVPLGDVAPDLVPEGFTVPPGDEVERLGPIDAL